MARVAVFVDAGYLFAQGGRLLTGRKVVRGELSLDHTKVAEVLQQFAERVTNEKLLRIYWYDGTSTGPTTQHIALAYLPGVKVRLGFVNSVGEQKGVDSLIVTDMIALARNRAMSEAILLSGDEDLRVGVQQAQEFGVRVHLLGIKPSRGSQSVFLLQESDSTHEWTDADLSPFLAVRSNEAVPVKAEPPSKSEAEIANTDPLVEVANAVANEVPENQLESLVSSLRATKQLPKITDGRLLARGRASLGSDLIPKQKRYIREAFLASCEARLAAVAVAKAVPLK